MTSARWQEIKRVLDLVGESSLEDRPGILTAACGGDEDLRREVESFLSLEEKAAVLDEAALAIHVQVGQTRHALWSFRLAAGARLGPYEILMPLGAGGMGEVYTARDTRLGRTVALKILTERMLGRGGIRSRFEREARAISSLNHPHICTLHDIGQDNDVDYLVMEYLEGRTLAERLKEGPLAYAEVLDTAIEIAGALDYAHGRGVIHRDVKPGNIMLTQRGAKLLDFGLARWRQDAEQPGKDAPAKAASSLTMTGAVMGTPHYMAPEQIEKRAVDARTDVFALGAVIYEMATGRKAFPGSVQAEILAAILKGEPSAHSSPQPPLPIARKAMRKDPTLRYQSAYEIGADLKRLRRGADASGAASLPAIPARAVRRGFRWALGIGAAVIFAVAALSWLAWPPPVPQVTGIVQVTHDGRPKSFVTDGRQLYYTSGDLNTYQIPVTGGDPVLMPNLAGAALLDISPVRPELLLALVKAASGSASRVALAVASMPGGKPRRLGDLMSIDAHWSPDGRRIVYIKDRELHIARSDGGEMKTLVTVPGVPDSARWSPDGRSIRFTLVPNRIAELWEVSADGSGLHPILPKWKNAFGGVWTPDARYYIFAGGDNRTDLWALREGRFDKLHRGPVQLTHGPMQSYNPVPGAGGGQIFFLGVLDTAELVRYDGQSAQWIPYLPGVRAMQLDFSRDGKWVAYVDYAEGSLWRSTVDGRQRLKLTEQPIAVSKPKWSPDGRQIAFAGGDRVIHAVAAEGGVARPLTNGEGGAGGDIDPTWSPDGGTLVFSGNPSADSSLLERPSLRTLDLKTHRVSVLPGSEDLWSPRWSPDGRYIAALGFPKWKPVLYDVATHHQTELADLNAAWPCWSRDSQFLYFIAQAEGRAYYRIRIKDRDLERLLSLNDLQQAPQASGWIGLTPDGAFLSTRQQGGTDIYALDWEAP